MSDTHKDLGVLLKKHFYEAENPEASGGELMGVLLFAFFHLWLEFQVRGYQMGFRLDAIPDMSLVLTPPFPEDADADSDGE